MKSAALASGARVVTFAIPDASTLRNKQARIVVSLSGVTLLVFNGTFPPSGGLTVQIAGTWSAGTVVADTAIDGSPIAAARDGVLSIAAGL